MKPVPELNIILSHSFPLVLDTTVSLSECRHRFHDALIEAYQLGRSAVWRELEEQRRKEWEDQLTHPIQP